MGLTVLLKREFAPTVEIALSLHPKTERAVVVAGTSDFDTRLLEQAKRDFRFYEERLDIQYLTTLPVITSAAAHSRVLHERLSRRSWR